MLEWQRDLKRVEEEGVVSPVYIILVVKRLVVDSFLHTSYIKSTKRKE